MRQGALNSACLKPNLLYLKQLGTIEQLDIRDIARRI